MKNFKPVAVLFSILFLIMLGFGIIIPVLPFYSQQLGATSFHLGLLMASYSTMQFIFAPIWGAYSDKNGRKPALLIGVLGFGVSFLIFALASSLWMLFAARILGGILSAAAMPTAMAYISDTTDQEGRAGGMGLMGAAMGLGVIFGPAIGGFLAAWGGSVPFFAAAILAFITFSYALWLLPESLPPEDRQGKTVQRPSLYGALRSPLAFLMLLAFAISFSNANLEAVIVFFSADTFGFGPREMGLMFMVMGVTGVILQGGLIGRIINAFGEEKVIVAGLAITSTGFMLLLSSWNLVSLIFFMAVTGVGLGMVRPGITSLISKKTEQGHGAVMGTMSSFDSLGRIFGPVWGGFVYLKGHSFPFLTGAGILLVLVFVGIYWFNRKPAKLVG